MLLLVIVETNGKNVIPDGKYAGKISSAQGSPKLFR